MVFVGQIIIKESNSQKGSEGCQVSQLLNFPYLRRDFSLVVHGRFLLLADRQMFRRVLGSNPASSNLFLPSLWPFRRQFFAACGTKLPYKVRINQDLYFLLLQKANIFYFEITSTLCYNVALLIGISSDGHI